MPLSIDEIKKLLYPVFSNYNIDKAILFGSFAKGTASAKSDIDLLVDSGLHGLRFIGFTEEVRRAVSRSVDIFDVSHIEANSRISEEIAKTGVLIYAK